MEDRFMGKEYEAAPTVLMRIFWSVDANTAPRKVCLSIRVGNNINRIATEKRVTNGSTTIRETQTLGCCQLPARSSHTRVPRCYNPRELPQLDDDQKETGQTIDIELVLRSSVDTLRSAPQLLGTNSRNPRESSAIGRRVTKIVRT